MSKVYEETKVEKSLLEYRECLVSKSECCRALKEKLFDEITKTQGQRICVSLATNSERRYPTAKLKELGFLLHELRICKHPNVCERWLGELDIFLSQTTHGTFKVTSVDDEGHNHETNGGCY